MTLRILLIMISTLITLFACDLEPRSIDDRDVRFITPSNEAGVMVRPPNQDMLVEDMWFTEEGPTLNSILPTRAPREGGVQIRIIGADFRDPMEVLIGGTPCLALSIESVSRMSCTVPAWPSVESVDVSIAWLDESSPRVLPEALTYYDEIRLTSLSPTEGPTQGNTEVTLTGEGFEEPTDVRFGGLPALSVELIDAQTIRATTPASTARLADVTVQNANGSSTLERAFRWKGPMGVDRIAPTWVWSTGGERVDLLGYGLIEDSRITLLGQEESGGSARLSQIDEPVNLTIETPAMNPGWAGIVVENGNGRWETERGLLVLNPEIDDFEVLGLTPERLPSDEGGYFMIGGNGFTEETSVRVAGEPVSCDLQAPQRLRCFTPSRDPGIVVVEIRQGSERSALDLEFMIPLTIFELSPPRASTAGGGLIQLNGRGFSGDLELDFNGIPVEIVRVISNEELLLRAPPHPVGLVDLNMIRTVGTVSERAFLSDALTYFDPISRFGGPWGPAIERSLNVTALDIYNLDPIEGVRIEVRPFDAPDGPAELVGITPEDGRVTLSSEDLAGPIDVTALKSDYEVVTTERVVSENLTIIMIPRMPPPEGEGSPPEPPQPARISGQLVGLTALPKPLEPGYTLRGFVDVSHSDMLNREFYPVPAPRGILTEDGPFEIEVMPSQMSVVATAAYVPNWAYDSFNQGLTDYWLMRQLSRPIALGIVRFLSLSPGTQIENITVNLAYPTREQASVLHLNPSSARDPLDLNEDSVPQTYETRTFLNLGPDGYWELDVAEESESVSVRIQDLPDMDLLPQDIDLEWLGTTQIDANTRTQTYHTQRDLSQEVVIGPYVEAPYLTSHQIGDRIRMGDTISWRSWPGVERPATEPAEVLFIRLIQGGFPVWSYFLPGGSQSFTLPYIEELDPVAGLEEGPFTLQLQAMTHYGLFDYQDFNLLDIYNPLSVTLYNQSLYFTREPLDPVEP